ncbi:MAG: VanZ family protein [Oscillospiraceae bacterium]|nr:VanZ family protein [Oscillospiraceae bacterium]
MRDNRRTAFRLLLLLTLLWMGVIFWFSSRNSEDSGAFSLGLLRGILRRVVPHWMQRSAAEQQKIIDALHTLFRKCGHFSEFCVLGLLLKLTTRFSPELNRTRRQTHPAGTGFVLPALLALLYACSDEFHQRFVPGRSCELRDVCIDTAGACCGILFCMLMTGFFRRRKKVPPADS